jgi:ATP-dependent DNA helicase RecQ
VQKSLHLLEKEQIIEYRPQKDQPQLFFMNGRLDANQLQFDHQAYRFRRERHAERIKAAVEYANRNDCRSQQLVAYFGETDAAKCGICDVCLEEKKSREIAPEDFKRYRQKLELVLKREKLSLEEILSSFAPAKQDLVLKVLEYLVEEGVIQQKDEILLWKG